MEAIPLAAGAIGGALFGSGSKSQASSKPIDLQAPEYQALRNPFASVLGGVLGGGAMQFDPTQFGPTPTASMRPQEIAAMNFVNSQAMDPTRAALLNATLGGSFLPGQSGENPFLNAAITAAQRPTAEALQYAVGRQIPGAFAAAGHQGSSRLGTGSTARDLQLIRASEIGGRALGDIATNMSNAAYEAERGRQTQAIQLAQNEVQQAFQNFVAQQTPRIIQQQGIEGGITAGQNVQQNWLQALQLMGLITAPAVANVGSSTSTGATPGLFSQLFPKGIYNPAPSTFGVTSPSPQGVA